MRRIIDDAIDGLQKSHGQLINPSLRVYPEQAFTIDIGILFSMYSQSYVTWLRVK